MKKRNVILLFFIVILIALTTNVMAEDEACKITMSADKTTVKSGDIVTVNLLMSNINKSTGIARFGGILEYPEDIFEIVYEEDEELKEALEETELAEYDISILYNGKKDTDLTIKNPWYVLNVKENGGNLIMASTLADPQKSSQIVGRIKFKVKENVDETPAEILLTEMEALDAETIANNGENGFKVSESSIVLTVNGTSSSEQPSNPPTEKNVQVVQNIQNKPTNDNRANNDVPYTGIEDTIPVIFILAIISILAYINYRKYKNI